MNNGQLDTSTVIIVTIIASIGAILLLVRMTLENRKNKRILLTLGIAFLMGAGVGLFVMSTELREILTAFAALFAVIIAALSINESRRIRQDSLERESRDRKERLVNEVSEWLRELEDRVLPSRGAIKSRFEDMVQTTGKISRETWLRLEDLEVTLADADALGKGIKEAEYYQKLTSRLNEELGILIGVIESNLTERRQLVFEDAKSPPDYGEIVRKSDEGKLAEETEKDLRVWMELIEKDEKPLEGLGLGDQLIISIRLGRNANAIRKSIVNAVDSVIELKTSLIQVP